MQTVMVELPFKRALLPSRVCKEHCSYEIKTIKLEPQKIFPNKNKIWFRFNYYYF